MDMDSVRERFSNINYSDYFIYIIIFIIFIVVLLLMYKISEQTLIVDTYKKNSLEFIVNHNPRDGNNNIQEDAQFKDLCLLGAFNCCNIKSYKYSKAYVNEDAILYSLKMGARCLDFQVYLNNNELIVASSNNDIDSNYKNTINDIPLDTVFSKIKDSMLNEGIIHDSFITIHIRVMSKNIITYKKIIDKYKNTFTANRLTTPNIIDYNETNYLHFTEFSKLQGNVLLFMKPINDRYDLIFNMDNDSQSYINCVTINYTDNLKDTIMAIRENDTIQKSHYDIYKNKFSTIYDDGATSKLHSDSDRVRLYIPNRDNGSEKNEFDISKITKQNYYNIVCLKYQFVKENRLVTTIKTLFDHNDEIKTITNTPD